MGGEMGGVKVMDRAETFPQKNKARCFFLTFVSRLFLAFFCLLVLEGCKTIGTANTRAFPPGVVVFSFDDGPNAHEDTTLRLLEVLEKHNIRGCFSLFGVNAERHPHLVRRILAGGHRIINHGYVETWAVFLDAKAFRANLWAGERAIDHALNGLNGLNGLAPQNKSPPISPTTTPLAQGPAQGPAQNSVQSPAQGPAHSSAQNSFVEMPRVEEASLPLVYRPHGGFYTGKQRHIWEQQGYKMAPCTVRIYDAVMGVADRDRAIAQAVSKIEKQRGGILLLHDSKDSYVTMEAQMALNPQGPFNRSWIPEAVEEMISILQEKGYSMSGFDPFEIPGVLQ
ncbi:MAG: polysaccharide deacetylase family protein [Cystobacterineae bacterium]|nr:polysaccharide deacetylase family protein [Cystobacterineae bacterium]